MNLIYNSEQYSVVEYGADTNHEALRFGGYEITDKSVHKELFIGGPQVINFRKDVHELIASEPSIEEIDEFLAQFDDYMGQRVWSH
ncbi:DUF3567 domain-containing protein [Undibacterium sp. Jales W-56]|uniref:BTH_I0359 family protein n=1 Tax=Undibacterium sp. Jales W-56 TaxID=2897325 RepID=UPI0021CEA75B|nr:DUF3567 domain-containing protein [Undibacterium sp. Jales W-56]MCU6434183.1 DUF3567 domain-containing protein [Undibacterium sp. Jales W-56]